MKKTEQTKQDREFSHRIKDAWKRYKQGEFKSLTAEEFLELIKKC